MLAALTLVEVDLNVGIEKRVWNFKMKWNALIVNSFLKELIKKRITEPDFLRKEIPRITTVYAVVKVSRISANLRFGMRNF